jgi:UDP-N-acetylmuramoyl-tripeptide--D-alanyl-D-alanine ligase
MNRTLAQFAQACGGRLEGTGGTYTGVSTDTRKIAPGELFVALRGPNFDGHEFVKVAARSGAAGAVVEKPASVGDRFPFSQIVVPDTQKALEAAAHHWRMQFDLPLVGVAGSNGKTTTKEMTAVILSQAGECLATRGNLNNHIGVPLTLLRLMPTHRFAVVEIGANRPGDVAALANLARPTVGLITNAGAEHLEGFGDLKGVALAEGEMVAALEPGGVAVLNADDVHLNLWRGLTQAKVVTFGLKHGADFMARDVGLAVDPQGCTTRFTLLSPLGMAAVKLKLAGEHNVLNALCAAAAASAAGATLKQIVAGLAAVQAVPGRLQFKLARSGAWLIDDSYNANPSSVHAGIEVLSQLKGHRWLVLGDMAELGEGSADAHREIGLFAHKHRIERLFTFGELAKLAAQSFGKGGEAFTDVDALVKALEDAGPEVRVLVKGSRVNRLERVVAALTKEIEKG